MPRVKKLNTNLNKEISVVDDLFLETDDKLRSLRLEQETISERIAKLEYSLSEENLNKDPNRNLFYISSNVEFETNADEIRRELYLVTEKKKDVDLQIDNLVSRLDSLHNVKKILYKLDEPASDNLLENKEEEGSVVISSEIISMLHDDCIQPVAGVINKLELTERLLDFDSVRAHNELLNSEDVLRKTIESLRDVIYEIRPMTISDIGFWESVNELIEKTKHNFGFQIRFDLSADCSGFSPDSETAVQLFKIIQEALFECNNHGDVTRVIIAADHIDDDIKISIKDDGNNSSSETGLSVLRKKINSIKGKMENISKKSGNEIQISFRCDWGNK